MTRPIRVAMVHYRDAAVAGGSLRVGETIANHLDPDRVSAHFVFAYGDAGPVSAQTRRHCYFLGATGPKDFPAWRRARNLFSELAPDIIHFQEGVVWLRSALARVSARKVFHVHGRYSAIQPAEATRWQRAKAKLDDRVLQAYLRFTDAQVCINHATRDWLLDLGWISAERSCVVYNAVDVERFNRTTDRSRVRKELGLPTQALLLGIVCRLVPEKGVPEFLSIVERLPERWHGVVCGDGPLKDELQQSCAQRRLAERIHFLGSVDDASRVYSAIDALAFVSRYDGFGLTAAEAMAAAVPVFGIEREGDYNESAYPLFYPGYDLMTKSSSADDLGRAVQLAAERIEQYGEQPQVFEPSISKSKTWVASCFHARFQAEAMTRVYEDLYRGEKLPQQWLGDFYRSNHSRASDRLNYEAGAATATA